MSFLYLQIINKIRHLKLFSNNKIFKKMEKIENNQTIDNIIDKDINQTDNNTETENKAKPDKINLPKRKYAIIHAYNGHKFSGNQK